MTLVPGAAVDLVVPASAANLGPGFDSMGLALGVWDCYRAVVREEPGLRLDVGEDPQGVPTDERHLVVATLHRALDELGVPRPAGLELVCRNTVRQGRGMGSSAAAIVAGVALADALRRPEAADVPDGAPIPLDLVFVNDLAAALEGHPDNSSASVFGGGTLSVVGDGIPAGRAGGRGVPHVNTVRLALHDELDAVVFVPATQLATHTARAALPEVVPHADAALNGACTALLVHALTADPRQLLSATRDRLHQEQRRSAYPEAMALVDALRAEGHAAVISGAGPSVLVLTTTSERDQVQVPTGCEDGEARWQRVCPGIPSSGVQTLRATLGASHGEHAVSRQRV